MGKLTALGIGRTRKPGFYGDGDNLWLKVGPNGGKSWVFRYGKRYMGLGPLELVSLAEAREKAREARRLRLDGVDPLEDKRAKRRQASLAAARGITFKESAERYIAAHRAGWRDHKSEEQWRSSLAADVFPVFGDLAVADIDTGLVLKALEPIWTAKPETASRVRGRIEAILDWAKVRGYREGENPARWRGHLDKMLPSKRKVRSVEHLAAMPYGEMPAFMATLRENDHVAARALEFTILTGARSGEVRFAEWSEFDLDAGIWTVPGVRMKAGRDQRVPLSDRALEVLRSFPHEADNPFVFMGDRPGKPIGQHAMRRVLELMGISVTIHGFRSSFRDWASDRTNYPHEVVEQALAHAISSAVERAYRRTDLFDRRRRLMADWASFCASPPRDGQVLPIRGSQHAVG